MSTLAVKSDDIGSIIFVGTVLAVFLVILFVSLVSRIRNHFGPPKIGACIAKFMGKRWQEIAVHEKRFPGFDLPSIHAALDRMGQTEFSSWESKGAANIGQSLREITIVDLDSWTLKQEFRASSHQRMPVDVDDERSFKTNNVIFAEHKSACRLIIMLACQYFGGGGEEDIDVSTPPPFEIVLSIMCPDRELTDQFFGLLNRYRRELSIFRGKVIDPVIDSRGIQSIAFRHIRKVGADDLILPDSVRSLLERSVVGFARNREKLLKLGVELKRGLLLHGQPGTGKTSLCLYLAALLPDFTVCFVSGKKLLYPRELCRMARYLQPTMLVFEDIDLIAQERDMNGLATVLGELMNQIDGCDPDDQVVFIMNTNSLDRMEGAVRNRPGRVDQIVQIPLPDDDARRRLFEYFAKHATLVDGTLSKLVKITEGMTPAMIKEIVKRAAVIAIDRHGDLGEQSAAQLEMTEADLTLAAYQVQLLREQSVPASSRVQDAIL